MLQPIKNFLTYLQKSATNSAAFGITTNMSENTSNTEDPSGGSQNKISGAENLCSSSPIKSHDQNENEVIEIGEESSTGNSLEKNECSKGHNDSANVSKEIIHKITIECLSDREAEVSNEGFTVNEIILDENDGHNTSLIDPSIDPLAIDDYQTNVSNNNSFTTNSEQHAIDVDSSADETETIVIIDVDEIKESENLTDETNSKNDTINSEPDRDEHREELFETPRLPLDEISEEQEIRSDGSDSGLGSETSALQTTTNSIDTNVSIDSPIRNRAPTRSNLKRQLDDVTIVPEKRLKRSIHFDGVKVYYFPRIQGFACVPSQGGCTLGMGSRHTHCRNFTLAEHAAEQRRVHKQQMQEINPRGSSSEETDSDEELSEASGSDLDTDANGFLQPVPARQRRAILKAAGIRKIDSTEKDECRAIRSSREFCGCSCRGYCDPETCSCSQAGIKCQVDRPSFPCGCTRDGCANVVGRIEFNPNRVRTHFIHTIMRLELENKEKSSLELNSEPNHLLNYGSSCASHSNMSVTAANNCTNTTNNLNNNICNYSLSNINMIRSQHYGHNIPMQQHNQNYMGNNVSNSNIYSNMLQNDVISENCTLPHMSQHHHQQTVNTGCINMMNSSSTIAGTSSVCQAQHNIDINYNTFRDVGTDISICPSRNDSSSTNTILDYQSESYHGSYGNQSYMNHSYHNSVLNNSGNSYHSVVPSYSNYQQHYVAYASSSCNNENMEIHDLTTDDESNSYINLNPPTGNSSRVDAINDLLQNNRDTLPAAPSVTTTSPVIDPLAMKPANVAQTMCTLAPSAQTSTSITDGTSTTVSPQKNKTVSQLSTSSSSVQDFVDLTGDAPRSLDKSYTTTVLFVQSSTEKSQNMLLERSLEFDDDIDVRRKDSDVEIIEPSRKTSNIQLDSNDEIELYSTTTLLPAHYEIMDENDKKCEEVSKKLSPCGNGDEVLIPEEPNDEVILLDSRNKDSSELISVSNVFEAPKEIKNSKDIEVVKDSNDVEIVGITVNNALTNSVENVLKSVQTTSANLDLNGLAVESSTTSSSIILT